MYTVGSGREGYIGSAVHQDSAPCAPGKRNGAASQIEQGLIIEILFPNLYEIDRETEERLNTFQQRFPEQLLAVRDVVKERTITCGDTSSRLF